MSAKRNPSDSRPRPKRKVTAIQPASQRSAVTNGSTVVPGVHSQSLWVRRFRDVMALHISDLGGEDVISEAERSIIRRVGTLTVELERIEKQLAESETPEAALIDLYNRGSGNLRRLLESVGLKRVARDVTPSVEAYLDHTAGDDS